MNCNKKLIIISLSGILFILGLFLIFLTMFLNVRNSIIIKLAISGCVLFVSGFLSIISILLLFNKKEHIELNNNLDDDFNSNDEIDIKYFLENSINQEEILYQNV